MIASALYPRLCGSAWAELDETVRRFHEVARAAPVRGRFDVARRGRFVTALAWLLGLPRAGESVSTSLEIIAHPRGETWRRSFGGRPFVTEQYESSGLLAEHTRFLELRFRVAVDRGALSLELVSAALRILRCRLRLPAWLSPRIRAREWRERDEAKRMRVEVELSAPAIGRVLAYSGFLDLDAEP